MTHPNKIHKFYRDNDLLRKSFNTLANETYGLNFEDWYQNGYWGDNYIPYSIVASNQVIANASVNIMDFDSLGTKNRYIQIGTVMTAPSYRNQGLSRILIEEIINDYRKTVDGFFLFANDSVLNFYPRFGFRKGQEYQYSRSVRNEEAPYAVQIPMNDKGDWALLEDAILKSYHNSAFGMRHNVSLIMFYITKFMREQVFYIEKQKAYVIAEIKDEMLVIYDVFSPSYSDINQIIAAFGRNIKTVTLGFTPLEKQGFDESEVHEEDTTLFLMGDGFDFFEEKKMMFPLLGHA